MSKPNYEGPSEFKPITAWGYVGYTLLYSIPILGWIFLLVFSFSGKNINRRSFARSYFCMLLICVLIAAGMIYSGMLRLDQYLRLRSLLPSAQAITLLDKAEEAEPWYVKRGISIKGVRPEFIDEMTEYVDIYVAYVDFMKKYNTSSNSWMMLMDYLDMLKQYTEAMQALEAIDKQTLSEADQKFMVQTMLYIDSLLIDAL